MRRFALWFAWLNLIGTTIIWPYVQLTNDTEPPLVLALSFYAIWQGALVFIITAHIEKYRDKE